MKRHSTLDTRHSMTHAMVRMAWIVGYGASACTAGPAPDQDDGARVVSAEDLSSTSAAAQQALVSDITPVEPTVVRVEPIAFDPPRPDVFETPQWAMSDANADRGTPPENHQLVAHVSGTDPVVKYLKFDTDKMADLAAVLSSRGIPDQTPPDEVPMRTMGWSCGTNFQGSSLCFDGVDDRIDLSGHSNWEYRTYGRLNAAGGCTATLFGRRLAITAAHCVVNGKGNYVPGTFSAGRNGNSNPFGTQSVIAAWWGGKFIQNCTNGAPGYWSDCLPEEWALLLLEDKFPSGHPGWLGYAWLNESDTQTRTKRSVGYPGCGHANSPASCVTDRLYGQTGGCTLGQFMYPFNTGWNTTFSHGCDTSPGHSGSAMYAINAAGAFHIVSVWAVERCTTCTQVQQSDATIRRNPNLDKRIDDFIFNLMSNLRAAYP